jgi:CheY-like chemotaxis protein
MPAVRELLRLILEDGGYEVDEARHGGEAITHMRDTLPDLVMTDLMMPVMTGQQLVTSLRSNRRTAPVPILVLSANPNAAKIATQADAVVGKPFKRANLLATVNALCSEVNPTCQSVQQRAESVAFDVEPPGTSDRLSREYDQWPCSSAE